MTDFIIGNVTSMGTVLCFIIGAALVLLGAFSLIMIATTLIARSIYVAIGLFVLDILVYYTIYEVSKAAYSTGKPSTPMGYWFANMSPTYRWILMIVLLIIAVVRVVWVYRTMKTTISQFSVGDNLDLMPIGVAFSNDYGQVMQANKTINELSFQMTGNVMMNEKEFWKEISSGNLKEGELVNIPDLTAMEEGTDETPIISMPDGKVWLFVKTQLESKIGPISQIVAIDATKEEKLVQELNHSNEQLRDMNRRLRRYHEEVDDTVRSEELLEAKMRVHDKMGETLLAAKMYLTNPESPVDAEAVLKSWEQDLVLLREESDKEEGPRQVDRFMDAAKHLGIDLKIVGDLPENREVMNLICVGIQECMTNALQHSEANQMVVTILKDDFSYTVDYSDNGKTPTYPIKEGGGLKLIRETAERMEANMKYGDGRHFHLTLEIPRPDSDL